MTSKDCERSAPLSDEERIVEAEIARALRPYAALLAPAVLAHFEDVLRDVLSTHPVATRLVARRRPPPVLDESGTVSTDPHAGPETDDDQAEAAGVKK